MHAIFTHRFTVNEDPENYIRHVNNLRYLEWFIDTAIEHASLLGWGLEACKSKGLAWVAKSHHIEYHRPAYQGDKLIIHTWIRSVGKSRVTRCYKCVGEDDAKVIATAETVWVIVDHDSGRPKPLPSDLLEKFKAVSEKDAP